LIKKELYFWPFSSFLNKTGAIPVDRKSSHNLVDEMVARFRTAPNMILMLSPEGTRKAVDYWKSGFYHIALGAGVPIYFGYLDYATKTAGFGPAFYPTGNMEEDLKVMRDFYKDKVGKNPAQFNLQGIRFKERRATT
jgi:1-acyl-sn-glycerol-3-phosphate acyltransferase